jgi:hypothetical protein
VGRPETTIKEVGACFPWAHSGGENRRLVTLIAKLTITQPPQENFCKGMKKATILFALVSILSTLTLFIACHKDADQVESAQVRQSIVEERDIVIGFSPLTKSAIDHNLNTDYEFAGRTMYEHYMYYSDRDPMTYFNFSVDEANAIRDTDQFFEREFGELETAEQVIEKMVNLRLINSKSDLDYLNSYFDQLETLFTELENDAIANVPNQKDFGTIYFEIIDLENAVQQDQNLTDEQKFNILSLSSIIRNQLKYGVSSGQIEERGLGDRCVFGITISCWWKHAKAELFLMVGYQIALGYAIAGTAGIGTPIVALAYGLLMTGTLIKAFEKVGGKPECLCDSDEQMGCNKPDGIVILATPCSNIQTLKAIDYGAHTLQFQWSLDLAKVVAVDYPGIAEPITDENTLRVQMVAPYNTADIGVRLIGCPNVSTLEYGFVEEMPIGDAAGSTGTLFVNGANQGMVEMESFYSLSGTALNGTGSTFSMTCSNPGEIIQNTGTTLRVLWNAASNNATVSGRATSCTGQVVTATKQVNVVDP